MSSTGGAYPRRYPLSHAIVWNSIIALCPCSPGTAGPANIYISPVHTQLLLQLLPPQSLPTSRPPHRLVDSDSAFSVAVDFCRVASFHGSLPRYRNADLAISFLFSLSCLLAFADQYASLCKLRRRGFCASTASVVESELLEQD
jgi:hypothetical protein